MVQNLVAALTCITSWNVTLARVTIGWSTWSYLNGSDSRRLRTNGIVYGLPYRGALRSFDIRYVEVNVLCPTRYAWLGRNMLNVATQLPELVLPTASIDPSSPCALLYNVVD